MASRKGQETKKAFVLATYQKLQHQKASSLTVRELARELGYSPAVLYRYFESFEELIVVASVHFLNQYMMEYAKLLDSDKDLVTVYLEGWRLFNAYAFERPDLYYGLFWGEYNNVFESAVAEYFEIFPFSGSEKFPAYYYTMLFTDNIYERDFQMLRRCVGNGQMKEREAQFLCRTNPLIMKGLLSEGINADVQKRKDLEQECNQLLYENMQYVLKPEVAMA